MAEQPATTLVAMDAAEVLAQLREDTGLREMARSLLLGDELLRLPSAFVGIEKRIARLEDAVTTLVQGQVLLQQGHTRLEQRQTSLEQGFARLEQRQTSFEQGLDALRKEMGSLSRTLGGTAEEDALDALEGVVRRRGYTFLSEPSAVDLDGDGELDLLARVRDASGREISVLVEAKVRLRAREVRSWAARLREPDFLQQLLQAGAPAPYLAYAYGIRVYGEARDAARAVGIGVLSSKGEDVEATLLAG